MKNIPRSETKASLTLKLTDFLQLAELRIILPNLVYQDGSDTAIVICANVEGNLLIFDCLIILQKECLFWLTS
jgi:hypothetical protein